MICENCKIKHDGQYGSGRFCSSKCARGFSTKSKRSEINLKVAKSLQGKQRGGPNSGESIPTKVCPHCGKEFLSRGQFCSKSCASKANWIKEDYRKTVVDKINEKCSSLEERKRMRDIGRKGGFGRKGHTVKGTRYESTLEKKCFEYLEENDIDFDSHKYLPNSSKISDIYLSKFDVWIELDGINREAKKDSPVSGYKYWKEKLRIYEEQKLNYEIFYSFEEFKKYVQEFV